MARAHGGQHPQFYDGRRPSQRDGAHQPGDGRDYAVEYLSSFKLRGSWADAGADARGHTVHLPQSTWCAEAQWRTRTLGRLWLRPRFRRGQPFLHAEGRAFLHRTWPAGEHLPRRAERRGGRRHHRLAVGNGGELELGSFRNGGLL